MSFLHVVIPVYNAAPFLRETVASVLNQPYQGIEIVLVDDGSTDGSGRLCDELAAQNDRVTVIHQENAGVSAARNVGIRHFLDSDPCDEACLIFLDSDDIWAPDVLTSTLCSRIRQEIDTDVFVFGSCTSNSGVTRFSYPLRYTDVCQEGGSGCIWKVQGHFCANLYRLRLFRRWGIRFMENLKYSEDKIFALQCVFLAQQVRFLPQILHIYRNNSTSAMKQIFAIDPIDYYIPIINGWIASDHFLNAFTEQSGRSTNSGVSLASIYFLDMAQEHFERWHRPSRLYAAHQAHPSYHLFVNMNPECVSAKQYQNHNLLLHHPLRYRLRYNAIGVVKFAARMALQIKPFKMLWQCRKYPLTEMPR